jgi:aspartyl-tRNA(Asn)/glutamyl-tRNA(Gln) amidotransferase subunit B
MQMTENKIETVIGLEIHAQLNTQRKMFCGCNNNAEGKEPNAVTCPRCLGMPGTLPVANREALLKAVQIGLVFNSKINSNAKFDRKHYFYPDLPKGYQISQYDQPVCIGGQVEISTETGKKTIRFNRVHLEEDAGKLTHPADQKYSLVDLNRASTPLVEMVTEPDLKSPAEAKAFMKLVQAELINQGVSDADMEKGHMRCDANISHRRGNEFTGIVEIKNLNSFRFVEKALAFEVERQTAGFEKLKLEKGKITRGFNSQTGETYEQRRKEEAADYRYFPEPDLPPINAELLVKEASERLQDSVPKKLELLESQAGLSFDESMKVLTEKALKDYIWSEINQEYLPALAKFLVHSPELLSQNKTELINYAKAISGGKISASLAKQKLISGEKFSAEAHELNTDELTNFVVKLIKDNPDAAGRYKSGKTNLLGFFVGQTMARFRGQFEPKLVNEIITKELEK